MGKLDVVAAGFAGWRLIRRRPLTPAVWGLVMALAFGAPFAVFFSLMIGRFSKPVEDDPAAFGPFIFGFLLFWLFAVVAQVVLTGVMYGAVYRAVLKPEQSRWWHMRLGKAELWVVLVQFLTSMLFSLAFQPLMMIAMFSFAGAGSNPQPTDFIVPGLVGLLAVVLTCWVGLRLSMALPMSWDDKAFRLFESWPLTRGQALPLLGVLVVSLWPALLFSLAVYLVLGALFLAALPLAGIDLAAFFANPAATFEAADPFAFMRVWTFVLPVAFLSFGYFTALSLAPWAEAYRQLKAPDPAG